MGIWWKDQFLDSWSYKIHRDVSNVNEDEQKDGTVDYLHNVNSKTNSCVSKYFSRFRFLTFFHRYLTLALQKNQLWSQEYASLVKYWSIKVILNRKKINWKDSTAYYHGLSTKIIFPMSWFAPGCKIKQN